MQLNSSQVKKLVRKLRIFLNSYLQYWKIYKFPLMIYKKSNFCFIIIFKNFCLIIIFKMRQQTTLSKQRGQNHFHSLIGSLGWGGGGGGVRGNLSHIPETKPILNCTSEQVNDWHLGSLIKSHSCALYIRRKKIKLYFRGLYFTSHCLNLQLRISF